MTGIRSAMATYGQQSRVRTSLVSLKAFARNCINRRQRAASESAQESTKEFTGSNSEHIVYVRITIDHNGLPILNLACTCKPYLYSIIGEPFTTITVDRAIRLNQINSCAVQHIEGLYNGISSSH